MSIAKLHPSPIPSFFAQLRFVQNTFDFEVETLVEPPAKNGSSLHPHPSLVAHILADKRPTALANIVTTVPYIRIHLICVVALQCVQTLVRHHTYATTLERVNSIHSQIIVEHTLFALPRICLMLHEPNIRMRKRSLPYVGSSRCDMCDPVDTPHCCYEGMRVPVGLSPLASLGPPNS